MNEDVVCFQIIMATYVPAGNWERAAETCRIIKAEEKDGYIVII